MGEKTTDEVLDTDAMEKSFNDAVEDLKKAIGDPVEDDPKQKEQDLEKAKASKAKDDKKAKDEEEEEEEEEVDDEEAKGVKKSVEDMLADDPEAEAAMDVEPFLRQLVKAIDGRFNTLAKSMDQKLGTIETLAKAQGRATITQTELVKAQADTVEKIANQDQKVLSIQRLQKSRFENPGGDSVELQGPEILEKSTKWLKEDKIDLLEAGMIETRINKGVLGKQNDALDRKVGLLVKEAV